MITLNDIQLWLVLAFIGTMAFNAITNTHRDKQFDEMMEEIRRIRELLEEEE